MKNNIAVKWRNLASGLSAPKAHTSYCFVYPQIHCSDRGFPIKIHKLIYKEHYISLNTTLLRKRKYSTMQNKHSEIYGENKINFHSKAKFYKPNPFQSWWLIIRAGKSLELDHWERKISRCWPIQQQTRLFNFLKM